MTYPAPARPESPRADRMTTPASALQHYAIYPRPAARVSFRYTTTFSNEAGSTIDGAMRARLRIDRATLEDKGAVLDLVNDAREYLQTKGTNQWSAPWPSPELYDAKVKRGLGGGKTWNPSVWPKSVCESERPDAPKRQRAVYLHRLVTARKYAGGGLGSDLIDWAGKLAAHQYQAECIRIDVWRDNTGLHEYYMKRGFISRGFCADKKYPSGALFEKPVSSIDEDFKPQFTVSADPFLT
jgi:GNAT superfamily N-acetyltransferase